MRCVVYSLQRNYNKNASISFSEIEAFLFNLISFCTNHELFILLQIVQLNPRSASIACFLGVFCHLQCSSTLDVLYVTTYLEEIVTCIYLPLAVSLIEAGKIALFEGHLQSLALTWIQQLGLAEGLEFLGWLLVSTLWSGDINLSNFLAGNLTGILDSYANLDIVAFSLD